MKILFIGNGSGLSEGVGGSLIRTIEILKRISNRHNVKFLTTEGCYRACTKEKLNVDFELVRSSIFKKKETCLTDRLFSYVVSTFFSFLHILRQSKYDLVCVYSDEVCNILPAILYKQSKKVPIIAMIHHLHYSKVSNESLRSILTSYLSISWQKLSFRLIRSNADRILVYNSEMGDLVKDKLINMGVPPHRIVGVDNGIDLELINKINSSNDMFHACFIGSLRPPKGMYDIISIWKKVVSKMGLKLIIVGKSPKEYEDYLIKEIRKEYLDGYIILGGPMTHEDSIKILKSSKMYISPSHEEGWGIAVCEALAAKKPVVAYELSVYKRIFSNSITYVPCFDENCFSDKIIEIFQNQASIEKKVSDGYNIAMRYNWNEIAKRELDIYQSVLLNTTKLDTYE